MQAWMTSSGPLSHDDVTSVPSHTEVSTSHILSTTARPVSFRLRQHHKDRPKAKGRIEPIVDTSVSIELSSAFGWLPLQIWQKAPLEIWFPHLRHTPKSSSSVVTEEDVNNTVELLSGVRPTFVVNSSVQSAPQAEEWHSLSHRRDVYTSVCSQAAYRSC
ncbi:hypothetical protein CERZMDRAFT_86987 [Cercospora zeae-maydis SCOH1-5]|uniref:Uncharacterized protein n=1 Tax=Cercospora zeae-maydis SCOH1-5 TaxID=717836 RepID=A0A6A6F8J3_9PEZI|nr:hypothetical protein CERZMDRAFT_86987 [Cercospora zeae-maydis SCOH1-5]